MQDIQEDTPGNSLLTGELYGGWSLVLPVREGGD